MSFQDLNLNTPLRNALEEMGIQKPTPIQEQAFAPVMSGRDVVGIAQTGTGKTYAYLLPLLRMLKFSKQKNPRILIMVPTRELVVQVVEEIDKLAKYINLRVAGIYGGVNINTQQQELQRGLDIVVATPRRLYDLVLRRAVQLKSIQKFVIDEVDVMLDLGFKFQVNNIIELLPPNRQSIMFSATMTETVEEMINENFNAPEKISIAVSGTPLDNIQQQGYILPNFNTKANLLKHLFSDKETFKKILIFISDKRIADRLFDSLGQKFPGEVSLVHTGKSQNYRLKNVEDFLSIFRKNLVNVGFNLFDPIDGLLIPKQLEEKINLENRSYFSTVVGLAFRKLDVFGYYKFVTAVKNINLLPNRKGMIKQKKIKAFSKFAFKGISASVLVIYTILFGLSFWNIHSYNSKLTNYNNVLKTHEIKSSEKEKISKELGKITKTLTLSKSLKSNKEASYRILAQVAMSVPKRVKFDSVDYNGSNQIVIKGEAASDQDILKLIENLGSQELVTQASLGQMNYKGNTGSSNIKKGFTVFVKVKG